MESCVVHHFSSVYLVMIRYGDIDQQAFIGQAIKVWGSLSRDLARLVGQGYLVADIYIDEHQNLLSGKPNCGP